MSGGDRGSKEIFRTGLTRRAVAGGSLFGLLGWAGLRPARAGLPDAEAAVLGVLRHHDSASQIGRLAVQSWPEMADRGSVLNELLGDLQLDLATVTQTGPDELLRRMSQRIATDFSEGRTVRLDGWVLSLAEVRLCALAACAASAVS
ncbi:MAG TPA: hypothetical protein VHT51_17715 [Micropepsaceae bacterium]|jgi:hypothetical protein|nr:hypothetical protein [Micropepsaceae bacterium]